MFLNELFEAIDKRHASFCFGRMNPPTIGHAQLIDTVVRSAHGGDYFIFSSQSHDAKKNPLDYQTKVKFLKALFPNQAGHIVQDLRLRTIMQIAEWLYNKGYRSVTFVAGSDRLDSFKELLEKYNGAEGGNVYYKFDAINFISSGDRDPDDEGIAGVSASAARAAAKANDIAAFAQATGAGELAKPLFHAVRKGMLLEHIVKHGSGYRLVSKKTGKNLGDFPSKAAAKKHEREVEYFKHMDEASGVVKGGNDPRYVMGLTVDVRPETLGKEMKAFGLVGRKSPATRQIKVGKDVGKGVKPV